MRPGAAAAGGRGRHRGEGGELRQDRGQDSGGARARGVCQDTVSMSNVNKYK